jgi:two-component system sensor histidine kinase EvgS
VARAIRTVEQREGRRRTPILAITAAAMKGEAERCMAAGMDDYMTKPVTIPTLVERLRRWLPHVPFVAVEPVGDPLLLLPQANRPPPLDPSVLGEISGGDETTERDLLFDFMDTTRHDLDTLQRAQAAADAEGTGREAHKIKGASRIVGAWELAEAAGAVEQAGKEGDLQKLLALTPDLLTAYHRLRLHLAQRFPV